MILIVEDKPDLRALYERQVAAIGYKTSTAESGEQAWERLRAGEACDVIFTDISMPGSIDGVELVRRVKAERPDIDLIVMTAFPTLETAIGALKNGAYDYLAKPFSADQMKIVLERCMQKRHFESELTSEKALRRELEAAYSELRKVDNLKDAFMARVSHELRTPLMAASGRLEMLQSKVDASGKPILQKAQDALSRLDGVVADLLTFSDLLKGDRPSKSEPIDAIAMVRGLFEKYQALFQQKEVAVQLELPDGLPKVSGDPELLETALRHLVVNAALFNRFQGTVSAKAKMNDGFLHIAFENTGREIPIDETERVFDSFYQLADALTREVGGLGLGLSIVRKVVEQHGGTVRAKSREGGGAVFYVDLQVA